MPDTRPEPKYKVGDKLKQESDTHPQFNCNSTEVLNVRWDEIWGEYIYSMSHMESTPINTRERSLYPILKPLTNERILEQFLKSHRKCATFRRNVRKRGETYTYSATAVNSAIIRSFSWDYTTEGQRYWGDLNRKWKGLCKHFELDGTILISSV